MKNKKDESKKKVFLSIIVVTWNNENFIEEALSSCVIEGVNNYEVLVVHNASDDRTGELIQRAIKGYETIFRVVENEKNEGLGEARNIGIEHARGEYFIFLDGDDYFETDGLHDLVSKLEEQKPDVLFYDYQRVWDTGWKKRNQLGHLLYEHDASNIEERNKILDVFCIACNKAYRKEFVQEIGIKFPVGYYEDVPWTYTILLKAKSIYATSIVILNYRQRMGSILKSTDSRHLVLPERYDEILNLLIKEPDLAGKYGEKMLELTRAHLFARPVWPRLPQKNRSEYLKKSSATLNAWRSYLNKNNKDSTLDIARLGSPLLYSLGKEIAPTKNKIKNFLKVMFLWAYKNIFCKLPIKNNRVYIESYWGDKFECNPKSLYDYLKETNKYEVYIGMKKESDWPNDYSDNVLRIGSLKYWYVVATSRLLVTNTNFRDEVIKRKKSIHLQTHHGTPLKKVGIDTRDKENVKMNWKKYAKRCSRWDYIISSNPYSSKIWRAAAPFYYEVIESGYPRNDVLFNYSGELVNRVKENIGIPLCKKVILYAPTYRDGDSYLKDFPGLFKRLEEAVGNDTVILVRDHHLANGFLDENQNNGFCINVTNYPSISELLVVSDVLITDYSSVMFDFACLNRPIVLYQYDYDDYLRDRGMYFDVSKKLENLVVNTESELINLLKNKGYESEESLAALKEFNNEFCPWDDGNSSRKVIEKIFH